MSYFPPPGTNAAKGLAYLRQVAPLRVTTAELADASGMLRNSVRACLGRCIEAGLVKVAKGDIYRRAGAVVWWAEPDDYSDVPEVGEDDDDLGTWRRPDGFGSNPPGQELAQALREWR